MPDAGSHADDVPRAARLRPDSGVGAELGVPAGEQDGGIVLEDAPLMAHHGLDQSADRFGRRVAGRGFASEEVDQTLLTEEVARLVAGLGDAVGVARSAP